MSIPDWPGDACSSDGMSPNGQLLVAGAIEPDWGPADVPPARTVDPRPHPAGTLTLTVGKARLRQALRRGLKVRVRVSSAGKLAGSARRGRTTVAAGHARARAGGTATLTLRFTKKAKRTLARGRRAGLTVKVRFLADGAQKTQIASAAISFR